MKVYVVTESRYDDGTQWYEVHCVCSTSESAKGKFESIKRSASDWLASKVNDEDYAIDFETETFYSAYDSCTGDYSIEVAFYEKELVD